MAMNTVLITIFALTVFLVSYSYFIYPVILWIIASITQFRPNSGEEKPGVSILIPAFNEAKHVRRKLVNALALDYPKDKMEVIVGSDGSNDNTAAIVREYAERGVRLLDFHENRGKTAVQNDLVEAAKNGILVFTDAASFMPKSSLRNLISPFSDSRVGCVAGRMVFIDTDKNITTQSQGLYWHYEMILRKLESRIGCMIGVDGPLYALRRENYVPLANNIISDLITPLLVLKQGKKVILKENAYVLEEPTEKSNQELKTRRRITLRGLVSLKAYPELLSFKKHPLLAFQLFSHKVLRWSVGPMVLLNIISSLLLHEILFFKFMMLIYLIFFGLSVAGWYYEKTEYASRILKFPYYFSLVNLAATLGIVDFVRGKQIISWKPSRMSKPK